MATDGKALVVEFVGQTGTAIGAATFDEGGLDMDLQEPILLRTSGLRSRVPCVIARL
jgi:hypothetical protein